MTLILITGSSGTGKSTLIAELRARGYRAYEADDGFSERRPNGEMGWKVAAVAELVRNHSGEGPLLFAGCSEEQELFTFAHKVLLTAPRQVMTQRLMTRRGNDYGKAPDELRTALGYLHTVEPLLSATADMIIETTISPTLVADQVLDAAGWS